MKDPWEEIDRLAADLGVDENTRRVWRQRHVPYKWRLPIIRAAERQGIKIDECAFDRRHAVERKSA